MPTIKLSEIKVDKDRQRKELRNIEELAASIERYGLLQPIVLDSDDNLIAGFRRLVACARLGREEIEFRRLGDLSPLERKLIELEENVQRQQLSWWEEAQALAEIDELRKALDSEWSTEETAQAVGRSQWTIYKAVEIAKAIERWPELKDSKTAHGARQRLRLLRDLERRDLMASGVSRRANIFEGDALELIATIEDGSVDAIITNPPFGVNLEYTTGVKPYHDSRGYVDELIRKIAGEFYRVLRQGGWLVCFFDIQRIGLLAQWLEEAGFIVNEIPCVWVKPNKTTGVVRDPYRYLILSYEAFLMASKGRDAVLTRAGRQNVFIYDTPEASERVHPVQMSDELSTELVSLVCRGGDTVLDPFAGSGSVGIGALNNQCNFIGFELDPHYANAGSLRLREHEFARKAEE